jgi:hypothetical protein
VFNAQLLGMFYQETKQEEKYGDGKAETIISF